MNFLLFYGQIIFHCRARSHSVYPFITDGHLGCFYLLAVVNNAALNMCTQVFFESLFSILRGMYLGVELLGDEVVGFAF